MEKLVVAKRSMKTRCRILSLAVGVALTSSMVSAAEPELDPEQAFRDAMEQREQGNLFTASEVFHTILSNQPSLHRARLELAVTHFQLMEYEEAKRQADLVLNDPKTPANVRLAILAFLAQVKSDAEAMGEKQEWRPSVSIGSLYDTNVNVGPSTDVVQIGDLTLTLNAGSTAKSDYAIVGSAGLGHVYQSGKTVPVGQRNAMFLWQSSASAYRRDYRSSDDFDLDVVSVATGPSLVSRGFLRANINVQGDFIRLGSEDLAVYTSVMPTLTWQFTGGELTFEGSRTDRDYSRTQDQGRNGTYRMVGAAFGQYYMNRKVAAQIGYRWYDEKADDIRFSNEATNLYAGLNAAAWNQGSVYARYSLKEAMFEGDEPVFNVPRDERETQITIGASHMFKGGMMHDWKLAGSLIKTKNESNVSTYVYDRDQLSVSLAKAF